MNEILKAQGRLADGLANSVERIFSDCFIDTAESSIISSYEKILGIKIDTVKSLEERRRLVKAYLVGSGKISASIISEMIKAYTGADVRCELSLFDSEKNNILKIFAQRGDGLLIDLKDVETLLSEKLPAHIQHSLSITYDFPMAMTFTCDIYSRKIPQCGRYICGQSLML